uniref:Uncharacterized protein n=1 Tax=Chromera velia CCMP2878 TaxID=1169474 RepID=A0A0G4GWA6_9ALVE|eukprot:Cvel_5304.t1-p1 / transcript=Cvel_5304.t1 / gene=Cvel_5304 / organism=Chromera_velia_CCMP2878 / gene_product=hypothetical protein / transcript_product=hypothetical protein / location=Cvel_scaffold245:91502-101748(+) / protein_length=1956 / sequence_SO=supercontig / SO=protein_coding / is_pseudo=false
MDRERGYSGPSSSLATGIPDDCLKQIFAFCHAETLCHVSFTCSALTGPARDDEIWEKRFLKKWGAPKGFSATSGLNMAGGGPSGVGVVVPSCLVLPGDGSCVFRPGSFCEVPWFVLYGQKCLESAYRGKFQMFDRESEGIAGEGDATRLLKGMACGNGHVLSVSNTGILRVWTTAGITQQGEGCVPPVLVSSAAGSGGGMPVGGDAAARGGRRVTSPDACGGRGRDPSGASWIAPPASPPPFSSPATPDKVGLLVGALQSSRACGRRARRRQLREEADAAAMEAEAEAARRSTANGGAAGADSGGQVGETGVPLQDSPDQSLVASPLSDPLVSDDDNGLLPDLDPLPEAAGVGLGGMEEEEQQQEKQKAGLLYGGAEDRSHALRAAGPTGSRPVSAHREGSSALMSPVSATPHPHNPTRADAYRKRPASAGAGRGAEDVASVPSSRRLRKEQKKAAKAKRRMERACWPEEVGAKSKKPQSGGGPSAWLLPSAVTPPTSALETEGASVGDGPNRRTPTDGPRSACRTPKQTGGATSEVVSPADDFSASPASPSLSSDSSGEGDTSLLPSSPGGQRASELGQSSRDLFSTPAASPLPTEGGTGTGGHRGTKTSNKSFGKGTAKSCASSPKNPSTTPGQQQQQQGKGRWSGKGNDGKTGGLPNDSAEVLASFPLPLPTAAESSEEALYSFMTSGFNARLRSSPSALWGGPAAQNIVCAFLRHPKYPASVHAALAAGCFDTLRNEAEIPEELKIKGRERRGSASPGRKGASTPSIPFSRPPPLGPPLFCGMHVDSRGLRRAVLQRVDVAAACETADALLCGGMGGSSSQQHPPGRLVSSETQGEGLGRHSLSLIETQSVDNGEAPGKNVSTLPLSKTASPFASPSAGPVAAASAAGGEPGMVDVTMEGVGGNVTAGSCAGAGQGPRMSLLDRITSLSMKKSNSQQQEKEEEEVRLDSNRIAGDSKKEKEREKDDHPPVRTSVLSSTRVPSSSSSSASNKETIPPLPAETTHQNPFQPLQGTAAAATFGATTAAETIASLLSPHGHERDRLAAQRPSAALEIGKQSSAPTPAVFSDQDPGGAFSPSSARCAVTPAKGQERQPSPSSPRTRGVPPPSLQVTGLALSADGGLLAVGMRSGRLLVFCTEGSNFASSSGGHRGSLARPGSPSPHANVPPSPAPPAPGSASPVPSVPRVSSGGAESESRPRAGFPSSGLPNWTEGDAPLTALGDIPPSVTKKRNGLGNRNLEGVGEVHEAPVDWAIVSVSVPQPYGETSRKDGLGVPLETGGSRLGGSLMSSGPGMSPSPQVSLPPSPKSPPQNAAGCPNPAQQQQQLHFFCFTCHMNGAVLLWYYDESEARTSGALPRGGTGGNRGGALGGSYLSCPSASASPGFNPQAVPTGGSPLMSFIMPPASPAACVSGPGRGVWGDALRLHAHILRAPTRQPHDDSSSPSPQSPRPIAAPLLLTQSVQLSAHRVCEAVNRNRSRAQAAARAERRKTALSAVGGDSSTAQPASSSSSAVASPGFPPAVDDDEAERLFAVFTRQLEAARTRGSGGRTASLSGQLAVPSHPSFRDTHVLIAAGEEGVSLWATPESCRCSARSSPHGSSGELLESYNLDASFHPSEASASSASPLAASGSDAAAATSSSSFSCKRSPLSPSALWDERCVTPLVVGSTGATAMACFVSRAATAVYVLGQESGIVRLYEVSPVVRVGTHEEKNEKGERDDVAMSSAKKVEREREGAVLGFEVERRHKLKGHGAPVSSISVAESMHILVTGSAEGDVKLWDLYKGDLYQTLWACRREPVADVSILAAAPAPEHIAQQQQHSNQRRGASGQRGSVGGVASSSSSHAQNKGGAGSAPQVPLVCVAGVRKALKFFFGVPAPARGGKGRASQASGGVQASMGGSAKKSAAQKMSLGDWRGVENMKRKGRRDLAALVKDRGKGGSSFNDWEGDDYLDDDDFL